MKRILLILIATICAFAIAEIYLRQYRPQQTLATFDTQARCYMSDPITYVRLKPNSTCIYKNSEYNTSARINSQGFRNNTTYSDTAPTNTLRIAAIGDSYTFGQGVHDGEPYPNQLETILASKGIKTEVINSGMPGSGVDWYYLTHLHRIAPLRPDLVLIGLYIGNDFADLSYFSWQKKNSDGLPQSLTTSFEHVDADGARRMGKTPLRYRIPFIHSSHLAQLVATNVLGTPYQFQEKAINGTGCMLIPTCRDLDPQIDSIISLLKAIKKTSALAVVLIPWEAQLPRHITQNTGVYIPNETNRTYFYNLVDSRLKQNAIDSIRILDSFASYTGNAPLLYKTDGHLTAQGHERVAQTIAEYLTLNTLISTE